MKASLSRCSVESQASVDFVDVTELVGSAYAKLGMKEARVTVFSTEPGTRLFVNECESGLLQDLRRAIARMKEAGTPVTLGSASVVMPAAGEHLQLGSWQRIFLADLDGPSQRQLLVQVTGE